MKKICPTLDIQLLVQSFSVTQQTESVPLDLNSNHQNEEQSTLNASLEKKDASSVPNNSVKEKSSEFSNPSAKKDRISNENGVSDASEIKTAEVFFVLLHVLAEYAHLVSVTGNAEIVLGAVDLLRNANARVAHLVLGAGAVELKICKSITVVNLAVVVRGLCLLANALPEVKEGFKQALPTKNHHLVSQKLSLLTSWRRS